MIRRPFRVASLYGRRFFRPIPSRYWYSWGDFSLAQKLSACLTVGAALIAYFVWVPYDVPTGGGRIVYGWSWRPVEYQREDELSRNLAAAWDAPDFRRQHPGWNPDATIRNLTWERAYQHRPRKLYTALALFACGVLSHVVIQIVENWRFDAAQDQIRPTPE